MLINEIRVGLKDYCDETNVWRQREFCSTAIADAGADSFSRAAAQSTPEFNSGERCFSSIIHISNFNVIVLNRTNYKLEQWFECLMRRLLKINISVLLRGHTT